MPYLARSKNGTCLNNSFHPMKLSEWFLPTRSQGRSRRKAVLCVHSSPIEFFKVIKPIWLEPPNDGQPIQAMDTFDLQFIRSKLSFP